MTHHITISNICYTIGGKKVLNNIFLHLSTNQITLLLGRNGAGKTILFNQIYYTKHNDDCKIRIDENPVSSLFKKPQLLTYLPQHTFIPKHLTLARCFKDFDIDFAPFAQMFPIFKNRENILVKTLCGGERRLLENYLIIKSNSLFSILDEPFAQLSPINTLILKDLINEEKKHKGFLITEHSIEDTIPISDKIILLKNGKLHDIKELTMLKELGYLV